MVDATIGILRREALMKRLSSNAAGGLNVHWSTKDVATLTDYIRSVPERILRDAPTLADRKPLPAVKDMVGEMKPDDLNFMFTISTEDVDLSGDVIKANGIDLSGFMRNPPVLDTHNSALTPIAKSTVPSVSGTRTTAIAQFPAKGVSKNSDRVAAAIRGGLVRGASVGFVPVKWAFSTDKSRPLGIDFLSIRLLEWSICALPCNQSCLLVGAVAGTKAGRSSHRVEERPAAATTRQQRLLEARDFRRRAYGV
jgi:hypothetical protein